LRPTGTSLTRLTRPTGSVLVLAPGSCRTVEDYLQKEQQRAACPGLAAKGEPLFD
jgi:hypothetical protein